MVVYLKTSKCTLVFVHLHKTILHLLKQDFQLTSKAQNIQMSHFEFLRTTWTRSTIINFLRRSYTLKYIFIVVCVVVDLHFNCFIEIILLLTFKKNIKIVDFFVQVGNCIQLKRFFLYIPTYL